MRVIMAERGQKVFVIKQKQIFEGSILHVWENNRLSIIYDEKDTVIECKYGKDVFMTRKKAEKVLNSIQAKMLIQTNKKKEVHEDTISFNICQSCGIPIGAFGHCRCSD